MSTMLPNQRIVIQVSTSGQQYVWWVEEGTDVEPPNSNFQSTAGALATDIQNAVPSLPE